MGHLINPIKFRLGVNRVWESTWSFRDFNSFKLLYLDDLKVMEYLRWFFFQKFKYRKIKKWRKNKKAISFLRFILWKTFVLYRFLFKIYYYWNKRVGLRNKLRIIYGLFKVSALDKKLDYKKIRAIKRNSRSKKRSKLKNSLKDGSKKKYFNKTGSKYNSGNKNYKTKKFASFFNKSGKGKSAFNKKYVKWDNKFGKNFVKFNSKWRIRKRRKRFISRFNSSRKQKRLQKSRLLLPLLNSVSLFHASGSSEVFVGLDHGFTLNLTKNKKGSKGLMHKRLKRLGRFYKYRLRRILRWKLSQYAYKYKMISKAFGSRLFSKKGSLILKNLWDFGRWEKRSLLSLFYIRAQRLRNFLLFLNSFGKNLMLFAIRRFFYTLLKFRISLQLTKLLSKEVFVYFFLIHPNFLNARVVATHMMSKLRSKGRLTSVLNEVLFKLTQARETGFLKSFKIQCGGRFTRKERATFLWESKGPVSYSNAKTWMDYSQVSVPLRFGTGGVKIWLRLNYIKGSLFKPNIVGLSTLFYCFKRVVTNLSMCRGNAWPLMKQSYKKRVIKRRFLGLVRKFKFVRKKYSLNKGKRKVKK